LRFRRWSKFWLIVACDYLAFLSVKSFWQSWFLWQCLFLAKVWVSSAQVGLQKFVSLAMSFSQLAKSLFRQRFGKLYSFCVIAKN